MADTFFFSRVWERILTVKVGLVISRIYKSCEFLLQTRPQSSVSSPRISKLNSNVSNSGVTCQRKHWLEFWLLVSLRSFCLTVFAGTDDLQLFVYLPVHFPDLMQFFFLHSCNILIVKEISDTYQNFLLLRGSFRRSLKEIFSKSSIL